MKNLIPKKWFTKQEHSRKETNLNVEKNGADQKKSYSLPSRYTQNYPLENCPLGRLPPTLTLTQTLTITQGDLLGGDFTGGDFTGANFPVTYPAKGQAPEVKPWFNRNSLIYYVDI